MASGFSMMNRAPELQGSACDVAVLPVGALEQHGPHLPVGTDTIVAAEFGRRLAERLGAYLLPPIAIANSIEHRESRASVYLRPETLAAVVRDVADSVRASRFRRLVVLSWHGGNWILKPTVRSLNRDPARAENPFRVILVDANVAAKELATIMEHPKDDIHAGEMETSMMLFVAPESVGQIPHNRQEVYPPQGFLDYADIRALTENGSWGRPQLASAEKGRRAMDAYVEAALAYIAAVEEIFRRAG